MRDHLGRRLRLRACVERWPGCVEGEYNPACCRFPKSCSCTIYHEESTAVTDLEESMLEPPLYMEYPKSIPILENATTCAFCGAPSTAPCRHVCWQAVAVWIAGLTRPDAVEEAQRLYHIQGSKDNDLT